MGSKPKTAEPLTQDLGLSVLVRTNSEVGAL